MAGFCVAVCTATINSCSAFTTAPGRVCRKMDMGEEWVGLVYSALYTSFSRYHVREESLASPL